ncbi:MAG: hypothetical protein IPF58_18150 [Saprospirales bacterium]|nr:hypothetical protein [Saprospirales bacterium]
MKKLFRLFYFYDDCLRNKIESRQSEVDSFPINYPGCDVVEGDLVISGDDIVNLNGLIGLKRVLNYLRIINNPLLINLSGLNNII